MTLSHCRDIAIAFKFAKPSKPDFHPDAWPAANRAWIDAVRLASDICATYGYSRLDFMDACDF